MSHLLLFFHICSIFSIFIHILSHIVQCESTHEDFYVYLLTKNMNIDFGDVLGGMERILKFFRWDMVVLVKQSRL
jgi:hypothetical protein